MKHPELILQLYFLVPQSPLSKKTIDTGFYLHTRQEPNIGINYRVSAYNLTSLKSSTFDPSKECKFVTHGYLHHGDRKWLKKIVEALLTYGDYNVFRVDWGNGSRSLPDIALANTKVVGAEIAHFINTLKKEFSFDTKKGHCIGHSMGGYVCGYAGQGVDKLGRITALDLGPREVLEVNNNEKLDPSDAIFVDAIHTDLVLLNILPSLGEPKPLGHIDIYVNGGYDQSGCDLTLESLLDPTNNFEENLFDVFSHEIFCSHVRPLPYYIEALTNQSCQWVAYECPSDELFKKGECTTCGEDNSKCGFLGPRADEYANKTRKNVVLFIETAKKPPFCVQHYVVSISTGVVQRKPPTGGTITFQVIGDTGKFTDEFQINRIDHGKIKKSLFINHVKVGHISSVKLTWKSGHLFLGLLTLKAKMFWESLLLRFLR
ncbi:Pancreatic triacylglycerol lipase [Armadillidium vulgare]|nr:Pancreatic triacylglycerol lipase [Armadillidium vulgare]